MTTNLRHNANLVESLGSALRDGGHGLSTVPALLRRVLDEQSWREFVTQRGEHVHYERFDDFVTVPPLKGLGASMDLVERVIGTDDPDLLRLLRTARKVGRGKRTDLQPNVESTSSEGAESSPLTADRLARDAPDEYEAVRRGEKSINAAAVAAGIRPHRISVRLDRPDSIARSLRRYMSPDDLALLAKLITEG